MRVPACTGLLLPPQVTRVCVRAAAPHRRVGEHHGPPPVSSLARVCHSTSADATRADAAAGDPQHTEAHGSQRTAHPHAHARDNERVLPLCEFGSMHCNLHTHPPPLTPPNLHPGVASGARRCPRRPGRLPPRAAGKAAAAPRPAAARPAPPHRCRHPTRLNPLTPPQPHQHHHHRHHHQQPPLGPDTHPPLPTQPPVPADW